MNEQKNITRKYRVVRFWDNFFAHYGYRLERECKFWRWTWWELVEEDNLGIHGDTWVAHYKCSMLQDVN